MDEAITAFWGLVTLLLTTLTGLVGYVAYLLRPVIAQWLKDKLLKNAVGEAYNVVPGVELGTPVPIEKAAEVKAVAIGVAKAINPDLAAKIPDLAGDVARRIPIADPQVHP